LPRAPIWTVCATQSRRPGGDNRAEFDTRLSHSVWYESPDVYGFRLGAQWSNIQAFSASMTYDF